LGENGTAPVPRQTGPLLLIPAPEDVTRERIRQIEAKALRQFCEAPERARRLRALMAEH
jgi:hypothetical protein